jgi:hypothetical protein
MTCFGSSTEKERRSLQSEGEDEKKFSPATSSGLAVQRVMPKALDIG